MKHGTLLFLGGLALGWLWIQKRSGGIILPGQSPAVGNSLTSGNAVKLPDWLPSTVTLPASPTAGATQPKPAPRIVSIGGSWLDPQKRGGIDVGPQLTALLQNGRLDVTVSDKLFGGQRRSPNPHELRYNFRVEGADLDTFGRIAEGQRLVLPS